MPFKNADDKLRWRREYAKRYPEKHKAWKQTETIKRTGKTSEQIKADKDDQARLKWVNITMPKMVKDAINEIRKRILERDGQFICGHCKAVKSKSDKVKHGNQCKACKIEYNKSHPQDKESVNAYARKYHKERREKDKSFKLQQTIRRQIGDAIRNYCKVGYESRIGKMKYLGCTVPELKAFLESRFTKRMTWENHGKYWHIDHIKPIASFDLTKEEEWFKAFNYQNLQPLEASKNFSKGARWWPQHTQLGLLV